MKYNYLLTLLVSIAITGCVSSAKVKPDEAEAASAVSTAVSIDDLFGKRLVSENGTVFVIGEDGTIGGSMRGESVVGVYKRNDNEICSTYSAPKVLTDKEYCSTPVIINGAIVFSRRDGSKSQPYKIEG